MKVPDDLFGEDEGAKDRPDHPDFWHLSEIVLQLDAQLAETSDDPADIGGIISAEIDEQSITYMAIQRAFKAEKTAAIHQLSEGGSARITLVAGMCVCYLEGFFVGKRFAERYPNAQK